MTDVGLAPVRSRSLADQVADSIVDAIATGILGSGIRLVENDLARTFKVSRVPVREALKTLTAQGILETTPHRGTRVIELDRAKAGRINEMRAALEKVAARDARRHYASSPGELGHLDRTIETMAFAAQNKDRLGLSKADIAFHREICRASHNEITLTLWETLARHILIVFSHETLIEPDLSRIVSNHRTLRDAIALGDASLDEAVDKHIMGLRRERRELERKAARAMNIEGIKY